MSKSSTTTPRSGLLSNPHPRRKSCSKSSLNRWGLSQNALAREVHRRAAPHQRDRAGANGMSLPTPIYGLARYFGLSGGGSFLGLQMDYDLMQRKARNRPRPYKNHPPAARRRNLRVPAPNSGDTGNHGQAPVGSAPSRFSVLPQRRFFFRRPTPSRDSLRAKLGHAAGAENRRPPKSPPIPRPLKNPVAAAGGGAAAGTGHAGVAGGGPDGA